MIQTIYNGAATTLFKLKSCCDFHVSLSFQGFQVFKGYQGFQVSSHFFENICCISSNDLPFVSGTQKWKKRLEVMAMAPRSQYVASCPMRSSRVGNTLVTVNRAPAPRLVIIPDSTCIVNSAADYPSVSQPVFTITEKAPTRDYLRHY